MIQSSFLFANITKVSVLRRFCFDQSKIDKPGGCNKNVLLCIFQKKNSCGRVQVFRILEQLFSEKHSIKIWFDRNPLSDKMYRAEYSRTQNKGHETYTARLDESLDPTRLTNHAAVQFARLPYFLHNNIVRFSNFIYHFVSSPF